MSEGYVSADLRRMVTDRARQCCEYCLTQERYSSDALTVDHINPRSLGGVTTAENLALCCHGCNQHKAKRTTALDPVTSVPALLYHPREQGWDEHFAWNDDFTLILGLTPIGRATISALQLNRPGLINMRRVLFAIGEHPPKPDNES